MFERRLKIFLAILLSVMGVLLVRAMHLQVFTRGEWVRAAEEFKKKAQYIETTRGRILDFKGHPIAVDEACIDACIDYRAIARDAKWIRDIAVERASEAAGAEWKKRDKKARAANIEQQVASVTADIDRTFKVLAKETGTAPEAIDEICRQIDLRVGMRSRLRQYRRYAAAHEEHKGQEAPWYRRWLIEGGKDGPQVDDFDEVEGEEVGIHPVVRNISPDVYLRLAREVPRCPGLVLLPGATRRYPYNRAAAHLMGNLAPVKKEDMLADPALGDPLRQLQFADFVGRGGLEALLEPALRGTRGKSYRRPGADDELASAAVPGADVRTTIDIELQDQIRGFFENMEVQSNLADDERKFTIPMHGAAVVIDVKTSQVRALASYPDFDPNTLADDYEELITGDEQALAAPLLNRATQSQLEPGSTIKPLVGLAAITDKLNVSDVGVMTVQKGIHCTGYLLIGGRKMPNGRCWVASKFGVVLEGKVANHPVPWDHPHRGVYGNADGHLCFADALERSCNVYFETCADAFGAEGLSAWYDRFGLGRETGLGVPEARGFLPRQVERHERAVAWFSGIGQVGVLATPVQMANVAATIARDGIWMRPRLVADDATATAPLATRDKRPVPDRVDLKLAPDALAAAKDGMVRVVNSKAGTGGEGRMAEFLVAGKTGTAQAARITVPARDEEGNLVFGPNGKPLRVPLDIASATHDTPTPWYRGWGEDGKSMNHAWFVGFAPADNPQVAFAVMVQYGGSGGVTAAQTAKKILMACVEHGYIKPTRH
ncbi:MAG TPA: penicillin-binding transpeptidase domain-containing protein [Tepidisphaeraceae bacterium]|nr:penicillin-binding transpeptidase domain-containing protein [Tepidisphaeraceae bacterium]